DRRRDARIADLRRRVGETGARRLDLLLVHRDLTLDDIEVALRERLRGEELALAAKISVGVTLRGLELTERGCRLVTQRDEVAIVQLREQLASRDGVADLNVESFHDARDPRPNSHLGTDARLDHAGRLDLRGDVAARDAKRCHAGGRPGGIRRTR